MCVCVCVCVCARARMVRACTVVVDECQCLQSVTAESLDPQQTHFQANVKFFAVLTACVFQFWPGGYCGLQQRETDRITIFSLWDADADTDACANTSSNRATDARADGNADAPTDAHASQDAASRGGTHRATLVCSDPEANVEPFGGEGTGLKCIRPLPWEVSE